MKNSDTKQINEHNENSILTTPVRQSRYSSKPNLESIELLSSINTPKGTKIHHPFFQSIFTNIDKEFTSPDMFNKNRDYPHRDKNTLSPDLVGNLFPIEINTNVESQHQFEENLFRKYQSYFDKKSAQFFTDNLVKPSPEPHDSGIGISLQLTESNFNESENNNFFSSNSMFVYETPPSKYKWNRAEYRSVKNRSSIHDNSCMSVEENDDPFININAPDTVESMQTDMNKSSLNNLSLIQQSFIGSPMFCDEGMTRSSAGFNQMRNFLRSSPHGNYNCNVMNELNLSPIIHGNDEETDTDDELMS